MSTPAANIPPGSPETPPPSPTPPPSAPSFPNTDDIPPYLRGKSLSDALPIIQQMEAALATPPAAPVPQTYQPQPPSVPAAQAGGLPAPPDPQLQYDNPAEYQRQFIAYNQAMTAAQLWQGAGQLFSQTASLARSSSQRDPEYADVWKRYSPEIDIEMRKIPEHLRSVDAYNLVASTVRGRHIRDFVADEVQKVLASGALERGGGVANAPPGTPADPIDALFADTESPVTQKLLAARLTPGDIRERYIRQMKLTPQQAADMLRNSRTLSSSEPLSTVNIPR